MVAGDCESSANSVVIFVVIAGISLITKETAGAPKRGTPDSAGSHVDNSSPTRTLALIVPTTVTSTARNVHKK